MRIKLGNFEKRQIRRYCFNSAYSLVMFSIISCGVFGTAALFCRGIDRILFNSSDSGTQHLEWIRNARNFEGALMTASSLVLGGSIIAGCLSEEGEDE